MPFCLIYLPVCFILYLSADRVEYTIMDSKALEELRNKYIKNPPEGMTAKLVKNMSDSDLLDMHYFLTEDDDWLFFCPLLCGHFYYRFLRQEEFPIKQKTPKIQGFSRFVSFFISLRTKINVLIS